MIPYEWNNGVWDTEGKKEASKEALGEILHFREHHQIGNRCGAEQKY